MTNPTSVESGGVRGDELAATSVVTLPATPDTTRRTLKRARRVIGAALAQTEPDPELVVAAELVVEAGGRR